MINQISLKKRDKRRRKMYQKEGTSKTEAKEKKNVPKRRHF